jgi:hypothetical protein
LIGLEKETDADKREKCELKNLKDQEAKYECINETLGYEKRMGDYC